MVDTGLDGKNEYSGYDYKFVGKIPGYTEFNSCNFIHRFTFRYKNSRGTKRCIFVDVEEYDHQVFIVKFYLKYLKSSPKRFSITTQDWNGGRILATCARIMINNFAKVKPYASFGFIGANNEGEDKDNTKRFRVYKPIALRLFNPNNYIHAIKSEISAYIILSKANPDPLLAENVYRMFKQHYAGLS